MCVVTIAVSAIVAGLLLYAGFCPLTIQMLVLAAVLLAACRATSAAAVTATEHLTLSPSAGEPDDLLAPPAADMLTHSLEPMRGGVADSRSVPDLAAGGTFEAQTPNPRPDVLVLSEEWSGPPSNAAGVFDDFTIAATVTVPEAGQVSLFRALAMTPDGLGAVDLSMRPGADGRRQLVLVYGNATVTTDVSATSEPVTVVCRRTGLKVVLQQTVHSVSADNQRGEVELPDTASARSQVLTPVTVGAGGSSGGSALLSRLLVWKSSLTDDQVGVAVRQGLMSQLMKEDVYKSLVAERDLAYGAARSAKTQNPYGSEQVQAACAASVADWTRPGELAFAAVGCKDAIVAHCKAHPDSSGCECYTEAKKGTPECRKFLAMMSTSPPADLDDLSEEQVAAVAAKYRLEDPAKRAAAAAVVAAVPAAPGAAPAAPAQPRRRRILRDHLDDEENALMTPGVSYFGRSAAFDQHDSKGRYGPTGRKKKWWWMFF